MESVSSTSLNLLSDNEVKKIFNSNLKIESNLRSIETLFDNRRMQERIIYNPYYQRNYVWDNDKASYFIESILLGTEIPPLVFFNAGANIEVIDGRQRFETIKRFLANDFHLTNKGLSILKGFKKKTFRDLPVNIIDLLKDTKIRIIEFTLINDSKLNITQEDLEDLIKKQIFRRYNSGITPLKTIEIAKAKYIEDDLTTYFKKQFEEVSEDYQLVLELFFSDRQIELKNEPAVLEKVMEKLRLLMVLNRVPISYYSTGKGKSEIIEKLFQLLSDEEQDGLEEFYKRFVDKLKLLQKIKEKFEQKQIITTKHIFECLLWIMTILDRQNIDLTLFDSEDFQIAIVDHITAGIEIYKTEQSHFYKNANARYQYTAEFFQSYLDINLGKFLTNHQSFKDDVRELRNTDAGNKKLTDFESLRLNKPDPSTKTIEDIIREMGKKRFMIRPPYQRGEAINRIKSSAIIESILLGVKIPPIFIFKRPDGVSEVIDGQQRLLSILGFLGEEFLDENGTRVKSEKNHYSLTKLSILKELNQKKYNSLSQDLKDKILDFNLSVVEIDSKLNPEFDPIDLFIRLNNKPYPIKEHSFEMWNSWVDREIITSIRTSTAEHTSWFYLRDPKSNARMDNEELYMTIAFMEYIKHRNTTHDSVLEHLNIFEKADRIVARLQDKSAITTVLTSITGDKELKENFKAAIKRTDDFIGRLKVLLLEEETQDSSFLKKELELLFNPKSSVKAKRTLQNLYVLWYILTDIEFDNIKQFGSDMKPAISELFDFYRTKPSDSYQGRAVEQFKQQISTFKVKFKSA